MPRYLSLRIRARAPDAPALTPASLADGCRRFTPLAAPDAPDGAMLDIAGSAHLFGGEAALADNIEQRLARRGYQARAALADTPEAAWALARFGAARAAPPGADEKALRRLFGPLPIAALRLAPETVYGLSQTGLKRIDDLLMRPRAPVAARFGAAVFARLDGLMGRAKSPISPRFEAPPYLVERRFAEPLSQRDSIERVIGALAGDLSRLLERHGEGARRLEACLFRVDGLTRRIAIAASRPLRDPAAITRLFRERITALSAQNEDPLESAYGFDLVRLAATAAERLDAGAPCLPEAPADARGPSSAPSGRLLPARGGEKGNPPKDNPPEDMAALVDKLGARLGLRRVLRFQFNDTHIPEFAVTAVAAASRLSPQKRGGGEESPARPLRLFERPEPVEALAEVPDGPPRRFRWRRVIHEVAAIEGPERIAPEWWKAHAGALTRDYFRVEDGEGRRFWLFREGLYETGTARPRWFLHGLFA